jgi:hypothetical protein
MNKNIIDIKIPTLDDVNYATSLNEVFDNINKNFSILSNHEFIKGNDGKSIEIVETPFFTNRDFSRFISSIPMGRVAKPEEISKVALFLVSDDASYISGSNIVVDGAASLL